VIRQFVWALTLPFARQIFCIGKEAMEAYRPYAKKTVNLPYSIDASRYVSRHSESNKPVKCLYIGQYIVRKGVPELLEAFEGIGPDQAMLSLYGSGELMSLVANYTQKYSHINEGGFVEPDELPRLISNHDLLLVPSHHDGWAVVVAEAMASSLPVISTRYTGAFVELGQWKGAFRTGALCEVNAQSIRQTILEYVNEPERLTRDGKLGRAIILASSAESKNAARVLLDKLS
jgi:glycosyltransferase involved in cell wall biosynthesis